MKDKEFVERLERCKTGVYGLAFSFMGNEYDAKDCFAKGCEKAYKNRRKLKKSESFETWLKTIVANECRMEIRKEKRQEVLSLDVLRKEGGVEPVDASSEESMLLSMDMKQALTLLDNQTRRLILLKYYEGYSFKDLSQWFGISEGTIKSKIYRGLKLLRKEMETDPKRRVKEGVNDETMG